MPHYAAAASWQAARAIVTTTDPVPGRLPWRHIEALFHEALELPAPDRVSFVAGRCGSDHALRDEVVSLLRASAEEAQRGEQRASEARLHSVSAARGRRVGAYEIDRLLGRGGMGSVYLAHRADGEFDQQIAIKLVDLPLTSELFRERFRVERQILANLAHPFIARLLDGGMSSSGELFLAMEYVDGTSIAEYADSNRLSVPQRLRLFLKVCEAVEFAHQNLIVHRDLKPDNILIAADGTPRLLDFGTAKLLQPLPGTNSGFTQHGIQAFTPNYASPEQVLGESVTTASDTYSLGVLLYLLLAQKLPYVIREFSTAEFLRVICEEDPPPPSTDALRRLDADLDAIVLKALRKEPQQRYRSVEQFAADITSYLDGRPVLARRGTLRYRVTKYVRRNRLPLGIAALLLLSLIAGAVAVIRQSYLTDQQRRRAEARSEDLRQLSSSLLSEIDEAIKELPGSTPVQRLLVGRVLQHLDHMSQDSAGGSPASLDIISAYTRLGNLQGNPYEQNIGDPAGAEVSLGHAIALGNQMIVQRDSGPPVLAALALAEQSLGEVLFGVGRTADAIAHMRAAVSDYDARIALPDTSAPMLADAASAVGALGDLFGQSGVASIGDRDAALDAYARAMALSRRALLIDPHFVRAQRGIAIDYLKIGNGWLSTDPARASAQYTESLRAWQALPPAEQAAASTRRGIAQTHLKIADAAAARDDYGGAIRENELARPTLEFLAGADANDTRVTYDLANFYAAEAQVYVDLIYDGTTSPRPDGKLAGQIAAGLLQRAQPIFARLNLLERGNRSWAANRASADVVLGTLRQTYGLGGDGLTMTRAAFATLMASATEPDASVDVLEMAVRAGLIVPAVLRDTRGTLAIAERLAAATHHRDATHLQLLALAALADGHTESAQASARQALILLPVIPSDSPAPRLIRWLTRLAPIAGVQDSTPPRG